MCIYSLLLWQEEGTLIGTAFAFCFGYWLGVSSLMFFIAYIVDAHLSAIQVFSLVVSLTYDKKIAWFNIITNLQFIGLFSEWTLLCLAPQHNF